MPAQMHRHLRPLAIVVAFIACTATATAAVLQEPAEPREKDKVRLCHAEGNGQWHSIEVAPEAAINGHDGHPQDIIPPFTYEKGQDVIEYPGKNWGGVGQETWDHDCVAPEPPKPAEYPIGVFGSATCETGRKTYSVTFGYDSENTVSVSIPIGQDNFVSPGAQDRGQPTTFQPGRVESAFTVRNVPLEVTGTWTVTHGGETRSATVGPPTGCDEPPPPTTPTVSVFVVCVDKGMSTYSARFGYSNPGSATVSVAIGDDNQFSPEPGNRGQPIAFEPGEDDVAVTVDGIPNGSSLVWTLTTSGTRTATASDSFATACSSTPPDPTPTPKPLSVFVTCVDASPNTFTATFGVDNPNDEAVTIAIGPDNEFTPLPQDRDQGTVFRPGTEASRVTVEDVPNGTDLVWTLDGRTATASSSFPTACTDPPPPPPQDDAIHVFVACVVNGPATYEARFGYRNENDTTVEIAVGDDNRFSPEPEGRGQTTLFGPGSVSPAFSVTGIPNGTNLVWIVAHAGDTRTAAAGASFGTKCQGPEPPEPPDPPDPPRPKPPDPPDPEPGPADRPIGVFVACVTGSGETYSAVFGYQNDNATSVTIPVGDRNRFSPGPANRGQVTEFLPGNVQRAFVVRDISASVSLTWGVTHTGVTRSATATPTFAQRCNESPEPLEPIGVFACMTPRGGSFDVTFGYVNPNQVAVDVPVGTANAILPRPIDRRQPDVFVPGRVENAFTVRGVPDPGLIVWTVAFFGRSTVAVSSRFPIRCGEESRAAPVEIFPLCARRTGSTYVAVFGYQNVNEATVDVPHGVANRVTPLGFGGRQPSTFLPGVAPIALVVPKVPLRRTVTWSLRTFGSVDVARASTALTDCRIAVGEGPDLAVTKAASARTASVGERIEYRITVTNTGASDATDVRAIDRQATSRIELLSVSASQGRCALRRARGERRAVCSLARLGPGDSVTIVVAGRAHSPGKVPNRVTVSSRPGDRDRSNNTADALVVVRAAAVLPATGEKPSYTG
jgi:uncharacterized repeat protein (TIGR01451 family)